MSEVIIEVIGSEPPCAGCVLVGKRAHQAAEKFSGKVKVKEYTIADDVAEKYKVRTVPQVFINGTRFVTKGKPTVEQLEEEIKKALEGGK